jgi:hypothetical protein
VCAFVLPVSCAFCLVAFLLSNCVIWSWSCGALRWYMFCLCACCYCFCFTLLCLPVLTPLFAVCFVFLFDTVYICIFCISICMFICMLMFCCCVTVLFCFVVILFGFVWIQFCSFSVAVFYVLLSPCFSLYSNLSPCFCFFVVFV